jgi:acylphosphatase
MTDRAAEQRHTVHFAGRVQGVGFRYTVEQIAGQFPVTGYVQNLPDGRVLLVMEGAKSDLDALIDRVGVVMQTNIDSLNSAEGEVTGEFADFQIRF